MRSFIPEKDATSNKRVYVSANNGKDLEAVDLTHLFTASRNVGGLIKAVSDKVRQMEKDKIDQPGLISMVMPKGERGRGLQRVQCMANVLIYVPLLLFKEATTLH